MSSTYLSFSRDAEAASQDNSMVVRVRKVAKMCLHDLMRVSVVFFMKGDPFPGSVLRSTTVMHHQ